MTLKKIVREIGGGLFSLCTAYVFLFGLFWVCLPLLDPKSFDCCFQAIGPGFLLSSGVIFCYWRFLSPSDKFGRKTAVGIIVLLALACVVFQYYCITRSLSEQVRHSQVFSLGDIASGSWELQQGQGGLRVDNLPRVSSDFPDSVAYFNWLFDMSHYGTTNWSPRVKNPWVSGLISKESGLFDKEYVKWSVAEGVDENTPDCVPVFITSNVDVSGLLSSYDGKSDIPLKAGTDRYISTRVRLIRRDGSYDSFRFDSLNATKFYRKAFTNGPVSYLTPTGRVSVKR